MDTTEESIKYKVLIAKQVKCIVFYIDNRNGRYTSARWYNICTRGGFTSLLIAFQLCLAHFGIELTASSLVSFSRLISNVIILQSFNTLLGPDAVGHN